jgi:hypothetical protein
MPLQCVGCLFPLASTKDVANIYHRLGLFLAIIVNVSSLLKLIIHKRLMLKNWFGVAHE